MDQQRAARRWILDEIDRGARPALARSLRSYLGSPLPTRAVSAPALHAIVRGFRRRNGPQTSSQLRPLLKALWSGSTYEERIVAIELLDRYLEVSDSACWRLASSWVGEATGWGLCDSLAGGPIARMVAEGPGRFTDLLRWTDSRNIWRRRASAYALHDLVLAGDLDRPLALLERLGSDPEFWVQRAVGTWLRECWKKDPLRTERFLRQQVRVLAPVTITVASERASQNLRSELRGLRASRPRPPMAGHAHMSRRG
jgi:3-methyladenine DNA glycosylase AlkD